MLPKKVNMNNESIYSVIARVLPNSEEDAITSGRLKSMLASLKAEYPGCAQSASSSVSLMRYATGVIRMTNDGRYYKTREWIPSRDEPKFAVYRRKMRESGKWTYKQGLAENKKQVKKSAASMKSGKSGSPLNMLIAVGKDGTMTLSIEDARALWQQLNQLFA